MKFLISTLMKTLVGATVALTALTCLAAPITSYDPNLDVCGDGTGAVLAESERNIEQLDCRFVNVRWHEPYSCEPDEEEWLRAGHPACCKRVKIRLGPCD